MLSNDIEWSPVTAIRWALIQDGMTQAALADKLGWTDARLSKILNGKQPLLVRDLEQISQAQGRDYSWYLGEPKVNRAKGRYHGSFQLALTG